MSIPAFLLSALVGLVAARQCQNLTIPVSISARNGVFNLKVPQNQIEVTNFMLGQSRQGYNQTVGLLTDYKTINGNYSIEATICDPDSGPSETIQVLTHGIGFDRSYWDFPFNNYNYSYVDRALAKGYSTFSWDRLGIGMSSKGHPISEIQAPLEISALHELTVMLREGKMPGLHGKRFAKTVHVGHSFGSAQTYTLALAYPESTDGIALSGFAQNATFASQFILGSNFGLASANPAFASYPAGYLAPSSTVGVHIDFFAPGQFDPKILDTAAAFGQPVTPGELLTLAGRTGEVSSFSKPVLIVTGEFDTPFCGGNCLGTGDPDLDSVPFASASKLLPDASRLQVTIVPGAGHGLNFEYSAPFTYGTILDFFEANGLSA